MKGSQNLPWGVSGAARRGCACSKLGAEPPSWTDGLVPATVTLLQLVWLQACLNVEWQVKDPCTRLTRGGQDPRAVFVEKSWLADPSVDWEKQAHDPPQLDWIHESTPCLQLSP